MQTGIDRVRTHCQVFNLGQSWTSIWSDAINGCLHTAVDEKGTIGGRVRVKGRANFIRWQPNSECARMGEDDGGGDSQSARRMRLCVYMCVCMVFRSCFQMHLSPPGPLIFLHFSHIGHESSYNSIWS